MKNFAMTFQQKENYESALKAAKEATKSGLGLALGAHPPINIFKSSLGAVIKLKVPGIKQNAIKISCSKNRLEINGQTKRSKIAASGYNIQEEIFEDKLDRTIELPFQIDKKNLSVQSSNGILIIEVPRLTKNSQKSYQKSKTQFEDPSQIQKTTDLQTLTAKSDIYDAENEITLLISLPGIDFDDINCHFENNILTVHAFAKKTSNPFEKIIYREFKQTNFKRAFVFSNKIDEKSIMVEYIDGILKLNLPKL